MCACRHVDAFHLAHACVVSATNAEAGKFRQIGVRQNTTRKVVGDAENGVDDAESMVASLLFFHLPLLFFHLLFFGVCAYVCREVAYRADMFNRGPSGIAGAGSSRLFCSAVVNHLVHALCFPGQATPFNLCPHKVHPHPKRKRELTTGSLILGVRQKTHVRCLSVRVLRCNSCTRCDALCSRRRDRVSVPSSSAGVVRAFERHKHRTLGIQCGCRNQAW